MILILILVLIIFEAFYSSKLDIKTKHLNPINSRRSHQPSLLSHNSQIHYLMYEEKNSVVSLSR